MADLVTITTDGGKRFTVARDQAERFRGLLNDIELRMPIGADSGAYNPRSMYGSGIPSKHASGHAVDINWNTNPDSAQAGSIKKYLTPEELSALEQTHGMEWGGRWNRPFKGPDNMHWESPSSAAPMPPGSPGARLPASLGAEAVPESGLAPLSLLPGFRDNSPFVAAPDAPAVAAAPPAPSPSPSPPSPGLTAGLGGPPPSPDNGMGSLLKAAAAPFAKDSVGAARGIDDSASVKAANEASMNWWQQKRKSQFAGMGAA